MKILKYVLIVFAFCLCWSCEQEELREEELFPSSDILTKASSDKPDCFLHSSTPPKFRRIVKRIYNHPLGQKLFDQMPPFTLLYFEAVDALPPGTLFSMGRGWIRYNPDVLENSQLEVGVFHELVHVMQSGTEVRKSQEIEAYLAQYFYDKKNFRTRDEGFTEAIKDLAKFIDEETGKLVVGFDLQKYSAAYGKALDNLINISLYGDMEWDSDLPGDSLSFPVLEIILKK